MDTRLARPHSRLRHRRRLHLESAEARIALSAGAPYEIGAPALIDLWVDPVGGDDGRDGGARDRALRSVGEAWNRVPAGAPLSGLGYRILLVGGDYPAALLPDNGWMAERRGTAAAPILIQSADGPLAARLHGALNAQRNSYLDFLGLDFVTDPGTAGGGNVLQLAASDHVLVRDCRLNGFDGSARTAQETLKVNQCQHVYVETSEFAGAFWFPVDFVAVQYGHILGCRIRDGGEDGIVLKGGTAEILVQGNEVFNVDTIGITAGQGTGFEFMVAPWIQYEAYSIWIADNWIHDVRNAGLAVRGGVDIAMEGNLVERVGSDGRGAPMLLVGLGARSCDGDAAACRANLDAGGWGPTHPGDGGEWIPNRNVLVADNVFVNPPGAGTLYETITVAAPAFPPAATHTPSPARADDGLQIRGNVFFNGSPDHELGVADAPLAAQIRADNQFPAVAPATTPPPIGVTPAPTPPPPAPTDPGSPPATPPADSTPPPPANADPAPTPGDVAPGPGGRARPRPKPRAGKKASPKKTKQPPRPRPTPRPHARPTPARVPARGAGRR